MLIISKLSAIEILAKNDLAIVEAKKAIKIMPNADSYDELAENYFRLGQIKECLFNHQEAIKIGSKNARLWFNYAAHLGKAEMYANSLEAFLKVQEIDPKYPNLDIAISHILSKLSQ